MRIYVYEYITALGIGREPGSPEHSPYREGRAMRDAVVEDLARIPGVVVIPFQNETDWLREAVARSDWQLVIAPEFDGILTTLTRQIEEQGGRILGLASE